MELGQFIKVARGEEEADLVIKNARIVNVFSSEIYESDVAIFDGKVVGLGKYKGKKYIDIDGSYICPGFIDGHLHIESSLVTPVEYSKAVLPLGTTTVIIDPHEIANVMGLEGIKFMLKSSKQTPLDIYVMIPSCVPSTDMETSGSSLSSFDLSLLLDQENVLGVGEIMNYPGVISGDSEVLRRINLAKGKRVDGHVPQVSGKDLCAYIGSGIKSDHESITMEEAKEKMRLGMWIMIREGSIARNLKDIVPLVTPENSRRCFFVTDDRTPEDLLHEGHINFLIKEAIDSGINPVTAIQMATINCAEYFNLRNIGAVVPGYRADLVVFDDFENFNILKVFKNGRLISENGKLLTRIKPQEIKIRSSINIDWESTKKIKVKADSELINIIGLIPDNIITEKIVDKAKIEDSYVVSDTERDILKVAVFERHMASGNAGVGFVKGLGLKKGAIASSVSHDSHNIIVAGTNDDDMITAVKEVARIRGGLTMVVEGNIIDSLPLPVAGLMSDGTLHSVSQKIENINYSARQFGCVLHDPFMVLSFLALPVIPSLRVTDKGLIDVESFTIIPIFKT